MAPRVLTAAHRNRALLARQLLLDRASQNPASVGTVLVDGRVVAGWSIRDGWVALRSFEDLAAPDRDAVEAERAALEAFHA